MTPERWAAIDALFARASEVTGDARTALLAAADTDVRDEVVALLAAVDDGENALRTAIGAELGTVSDASVGRRIGPYRLRELLGEGGMGAVYLATRDDAEYTREVAIKILRGALASPEAIARFRDERQILARLDHPAIVRLLDGGRTDDGLPYLVMEVLRGTSITRHAKALPLRERVRLLVPICDAIAYAHRQLVVHRDLKPSNILIDRDGAPKLLDFGIAKLLDGEPRTTAGNTPLTLAYASPEQIAGEPTTTASDVYSLGAVLFELVTGKPPRAGETPRDVPRDLATITARALRPVPAERYASAEHLGDDLRHFLAGEPVSARRPTIAYRLGKWWGRHRWAATSVALAMVAAIALGTLAIVRVATARRELADTVNRLDVEQGRQLLLAGDAQRALAYFAAALAQGYDTPAVRFAIAQATRQLDDQRHVFHTDEPVRAIAWSPDGSVLAAGGDKGELRMWRGDSELPRLTGHTASIVTIAWSTDGRTLVTADIEGRVVVRDRDGNPRFTIAGTVDDDAPPMFVTPDRLVVLDAANDVGVWDVATKTRVDTVSARDGVYAAGSGKLAVATAFGVSTPGCTLDLFDQPTTKIAVADSGGWLVAAALASAAVVNLESCTVAARFEESDPITRIVFGPANGQVVTMTYRSELRMHHLPTGGELATLSGPLPTITSFAMSLATSRIVTAGTDGRVEVFVATGSRVRELAFHTGAVTAVAPSPDGTAIASGSVDRTVRVVTADPVVTVGGSDAEIAAFDYERGVSVGTLPISDTYPNHIASAHLMPNGDVVTFASRGRMDRWRGGAATQLGTCPKYTRCVLCGDGACLLPVHDRFARAIANTRWIATASDDGFVKLRDHDTGAVETTLRSDAIALAWSTDGHRAATREATATTVWQDGVALRRFEAAAGEREVALDARGDRLVAAGPDGQLAVWDVDDGRLIASLEPHHGAVSSVALSPDGTLVATVAVDGVRLDDADTGAVLAELDRGLGHDPASTLAFDATGAYLAIGGEELFARVWKVARDDRPAGDVLRALACRGGYRLEGSVLTPAAPECR